MVSLPDLPVIPGATWYWVGEKMAYNGVPMSIKMFEYMGSEKELERFYISLWKSKGHGRYEAKDLGRYRIIGHELGGFYASVQYSQAGDQVKGKLVVTQVQTRAKKRYKVTVPKPPGSTIASRIESLDGTKRSETVTFQSTKGVDFNVRYYENQLESKSWSLAYDRRPSKSVSIRHYQKGSSLMQVTCKTLPGSAKGSHIIVHWIK